MSLEVLQRRIVGEVAGPGLRRHAGRIAAGILFLALSLIAGVSHTRAINTAGPTPIPCKPLPPGITIWNAGMSPIILPDDSCTAGVTVPTGSELIIDAAGGTGPVEVQVLSLGAGITVNGGRLRTVNTSKTNTVSFDADSPNVSWPGISFTTGPNGGQGNGSLDRVKISHAFTGITIDSGATATFGNPRFGLVVSNGSIIPAPTPVIGFGAFFDGIKATDTPIAVTADALDESIISNIGAVGIRVTFSGTRPTPALLVDQVRFGRTGAEAILGEFQPGQDVIVTRNRIDSAGIYGIQLINADSPKVQDNTIACSGRESPLDCEAAGGTRHPAIYLKGGNVDLSDRIARNKGNRNGLDAIALHGTAVSDFTWKTPFANPARQPQPLGYFLDGSLTINRTLTVLRGTVIKSLSGSVNAIDDGTFGDGSINLLPGARLAADGAADEDAARPNQPRLFTSLRDNSAGAGLQACPSIFAKSCPAPLLGGEWGGINLSGASAQIANGAIRFAGAAISITGGSQAAPGGFGLLVSDMSIGPAAADGIRGVDTGVSVAGGDISNVGAHGMAVSFPSGTKTAGLSVRGLNISKTGNEAILGTSLAGQRVIIRKGLVPNQVAGAGTYGIQLQGAGEQGGLLQLQDTVIRGSGTGASPFPAIFLNGVVADFTADIFGNVGNGNGLDAIVLHGTALGDLSWKTARINARPDDALGYLLDAGLTLNPGRTLTVHAGDVVKAFSGGHITLNGGTLDATEAGASKTFTSLADTQAGIPICPPAAAASCGSPRNDDWGGISLTESGGIQGSAAIASSLIRYATTGISITGPAQSRGSQAYALLATGMHIRFASSDGINTQAVPISVSGGTFGNIGQHGINASLSGVQIATAALKVDHVNFSTIGNEAILGSFLSQHAVVITDNKVDGAGTFGIRLQDADQLTLQRNDVINSGKGATAYPAIYLPGVSGKFDSDIGQNTGGGNALNAIALHGTAVGDLTWKNPATAAGDLGYLLDGGLTMEGRSILKVKAGDVVKVLGGSINVSGASLDASDTSTSVAKVFTSLLDDGVGLAACRSVLVASCAPPAPGDWGGINLTEDGNHNRADAAILNARIRYAATGVAISSAATATVGSTSFGLMIGKTTVDQVRSDGVRVQDTSASVTDSTIADTGGRGLNVDLLGAPAGFGLRVSGSEFRNTGNEAVLGSSLTGRPVWVTDNRIRNAGTYGIQLKDADELVLRNNNICGSGASTAGSLCAAGNLYPAIYLNGATADFTRNVRGNVGGANGLDAIVFHGKSSGDLIWKTPTARAATHDLGYLLDGDLVVDGAHSFSAGKDDLVKVLDGSITLNGGAITAAGAIFTSFRDPVGINSCASIFAGTCNPQRNNWRGIRILSDEAGHQGSGLLTDVTIRYATTGIAITSGAQTAAGVAPFGLKVLRAKIGPTGDDGILTQDTPIFVSGGRDQRCRGPRHRRRLLRERRHGRPHGHGRPLQRAAEGGDLWQLPDRSAGLDHGKRGPAGGHLRRPAR